MIQIACLTPCMHTLTFAQSLSPAQSPSQLHPLTCTVTFSPAPSHRHTHPLTCRITVTPASSHLHNHRHTCLLSPAQSPSDLHTHPFPDLGFPAGEGKVDTLQKQMPRHSFKHMTHLPSVLRGDIAFRSILPPEPSKLALARAH